MMAFIEKYLMYGLAAMLVAALVFAGFQTLRLSWAKEAMAKHLEADATAQVAAEKAARDTEQKLSTAAKAASDAYEEGKKDAQTTSTTLFADLAAQRQRLRPTWVCPAVGVSGAPTDPVGPSPAERDREESASRIVGAAAECDAHVAALLKFYQDQRTITNGKK